MAPVTTAAPLPATLGANKRLTQRELQRLYASPSSCGYLLASPPILALAVLKGVLAAFIGAVITGGAWAWHALLLLPNRTLTLYSALHHATNLGPMLKSVAYLLPPLPLLLTPLMALLEGLWIGGCMTANAPFNATADALQPVGRNSCTCTINPLAAGVSAAASQLRQLLHSRSYAGPELCAHSRALHDILLTLQSNAAQPQEDQAPAYTRSCKLGLSRLPPAVLVGALGGLFAAVGVLVVGGRLTPRMVRHFWRRQRDWVAGRPPQPQPQPPALGGALPAPPHPHHYVLSPSPLGSPAASRASSLSGPDLLLGRKSAQAAPRAGLGRTSPTWQLVEAPLPPPSTAALKARALVHHHHHGAPAPTTNQPATHAAEKEDDVGTARDAIAAGGMPGGDSPMVTTSSPSFDSLASTADPAGLPVTVKPSPVAPPPHRDLVPVPEDDGRWECCVTGCGPLTWLFAGPAMLLGPLLVPLALLVAAAFALPVGAWTAGASAYDAASCGGMIGAGLRSVVEGLEEGYGKVVVQCAAPGEVPHVPRAHVVASDKAAPASHGKAQVHVAATPQLPHPSAKAQAQAEHLTLQVHV